MTVCDLYLVDEQNDSNMLSSDHEVITNVLKEELGSSYQDLSTLKRLPKNENAKNPVELFSSQGSLTDTDISEVCIFYFVNKLCLLSVC